MSFESFDFTQLQSVNSQVHDKEGNLVANTLIITDERVG